MRKLLCCNPYGYNDVCFYLTVPQPAFYYHHFSIYPKPEKAQIVICNILVIGKTHCILMSNYTVHNYKKALTTPGSLPFRELKHRNLCAVYNEKNEPVRFFGTSSVVFKITDGSQCYALKCYTTDLFNRWEYLRQVHKSLTSLWPGWVVPFEIHDNELEVEDENHQVQSCSIILMPWIEGERLSDLIRLYSSQLNLHRKLSELFTSFISLVHQQLAQPFSHGDISPENIIVSPCGKMTLVDHDHFVFEGWGDSAGRGQWSLAYQHPQRNPANSENGADHFSFLVLALSLKALELDPSLFQQHNSRNGLLLTLVDYKYPHHSRVISDIRKLDDPYLQKLLNLLLSRLSLTDISIPGLLNYLDESQPLEKYSAPATDIFPQSVKEANNVEQEPEEPETFSPGEEFVTPKPVAFEEQINEQVTTTGLINEPAVTKQEFTIAPFVYDESEEDIDMIDINTIIYQKKRKKIPVFAASVLLASVLLIPGKKINFSGANTVKTESRQKAISENENNKSGRKEMPNTEVAVSDAARVNNPAPVSSSTTVSNNTLQTESSNNTAPASSHTDKLNELPGSKDAASSSIMAAAKPAFSKKQKKFPFTKKENTSSVSFRNTGF